MPNATPPCLAAALAYLRRGWSAIPLCPPDHVGVGKEHAKNCKKRGKAPLFSWEGYQKRQPSEKELRLMWQRHCNANVGVILGSTSGLVGIDIDSPEAEALVLEIADHDVPPTLAFRTGRGCRLLYEWPHAKPFKTHALGVGGGLLHFLGDGSQTVMPPSIHENGKLYEFQDIEL